MSDRVPNRCPDPTTLRAYARDELTDDTCATLDRHLLGCMRCRARYLDDLGRQLLVPDVPDCRVVKEIGRGRFGVVYKAWWLVGTPRLVALKVLSSIGEMERGRFEREIAVLRHLDEPGIVKCLDAGGSGDASYFIMDYVEGVHFDEYIKSDSVSFDEKLRVFEQVCRTVAQAHAHGVVHRDLKPRNILIDDAGQSHVLDFGICSVEAAGRSSWALGTLTHAGDVIGTLRYMSPEQAWGGVAGTIGARSDLWSLGIMLYELVTDGAYPYSLEPAPEKSAHESLLERIRKEMPTLPRLDETKGGRDLRVLLERCLAWEPAQRLESAGALADDIAAFRAGRRIHTRPLSIAYRFKRLAIGAAARSRWTFAAAFVAAVGVTLFVTAMLGGVSWSAPVLSDAARAERFAGQAGGGGSRDAIVVAGVFDNSVDAVVGYAAAAGLQGVGSDIRSWRGVHAQLLDRLRQARPRTVTFDYYFLSPQPQDQSLARAILESERAGIPVILASDTYDEQGRPRLAPVLVSLLGETLRHGAINIRNQTHRPGEFVVTVRRRNGIALPTLWLTTLAAVLHPDARLELDWPTRSEPLTLLYTKGHGLYRRERDAMALTRTFKSAQTKDALNPGALVGAVRFDRGDPNAWSARTVPYERLLTCSMDELRGLVVHRIVLVGDLRHSSPFIAADRHEVAFGGGVLSDVPGCFLVAEAIAGLLSQRFVQTPFPLPAPMLGMGLLAALVGWLLPIRIALWRRLEQPRWRGALFVVLGTLCAASFALLLLTDHRVLVWTSITCFALTFSLTGSFGVEFARNRHRVAERERRVIENFGFESSGTLTLPPQRLTSIPEIR